MPELIGCNVVLAATTVNPSIFSQLWLVRHDIFRESELKTSGSIFSPMAVNAVLSDCVLTVVPERLQLAFTPRIVAKSNTEKRVQEVIGRIVRELPHTPYKAVGFNMEYLLVPKTSEEIAAHERKFFLTPKNPLCTYFEDKSCHFGGYFSKDLSLGCLKLDIKPVTIGKSKRAIQMAFNFHLDLPEDNKISLITMFLQKWDESLKIADEMSEELGKGWSI